MRRLSPLLLALILLLVGDPLLPARPELACAADSLLVRWGVPARCADRGLADAARPEAAPAAKSRSRASNRSAAVEDSIASLLAALAERAPPALVLPADHAGWRADRLPYPDALPERTSPGAARVDEAVVPADVENPAAPARPQALGLRLTQVPHPADPDESQRLLAEHYPQQLRENGVGGTVVLALAIDARGRVRDQQVVSGSGEAALDAAAVEVARRLRFAPAQEDGRRVATRVVFPFVFRP